MSDLRKRYTAFDLVNLCGAIVLMGFYLYRHLPYFALLIALIWLVLFYFKGKKSGQKRATPEDLAQEKINPRPNPALGTTKAKGKANKH